MWAETLRNKRGRALRVSELALRSDRCVLTAHRRVAPTKGRDGDATGRRKGWDGDVPPCASSFPSCACPLAMRSGRCAHLPRHDTLVSSRRAGRRQRAVGLGCGALSSAWSADI